MLPQCINCKRDVKPSENGVLLDVALYSAIGKPPYIPEIHPLSVIRHRTRINKSQDQKTGIVKIECTPVFEETIERLLTKYEQDELRNPSIHIYPKPEYDCPGSPKRMKLVKEGIWTNYEPHQNATQEEKAVIDRVLTYMHDLDSRVLRRTPQ